MLFLKRFFLFSIVFLFCVSSFAKAGVMLDEDLIGKWTETVESSAVPGGTFTYYMYFSNKPYSDDYFVGYKFTWLPGTSGEEKGYYAVDAENGILTMVSVYEDEIFTFEFYYDISYDAYGPYSLDLYPLEGNPSGEWHFLKSN